MSRVDTFSRVMGLCAWLAVCLAGWLGLAGVWRAGWRVGPGYGCVACLAGWLCGAGWLAGWLMWVTGPWAGRSDIFNRA